MNQGGEERRKYIRADFPCKIIIGSPIRLLVSHTEDIAEGGIRVILEEKLAPYTNVAIELYVEKDNPIKCKGRIIWVKEAVNPLQRQPTMYDTGIEFTEIKDCDTDYLRDMVDKLAEQGNA